MDTITKTPLNVVLALLLSRWPNAVVVKLDDEIFVYENIEAELAWDKEGWSPHNGKTMVHLIGDTVVHDFPGDHWIWEILK